MSALCLSMTACSNISNPIWSSRPKDETQHGNRRAPSLNPGGTGVSIHGPMESSSVSPSPASYAAMAPAGGPAPSLDSVATQERRTPAMNPNGGASYAAMAPAGGPANPTVNLAPINVQPAPSPLGFSANTAPAYAASTYQQAPYAQAPYNQAAYPAPAQPSFTPPSFQPQAQPQPQAMAQLAPAQPYAAPQQQSAQPQTNLWQGMMAYGQPNSPENQGYPMLANTPPVPEVQSQAAYQQQMAAMQAEYEANARMQGQMMAVVASPQTAPIPSMPPIPSMQVQAPPSQAWAQPAQPQMAALTPQQPYMPEYQVPQQQAYMEPPAAIPVQPQFAANPTYEAPIQPQYAPAPDYQMSYAVPQEALPAGAYAYNASDGRIVLTPPGASRSQGATVHYAPDSRYGVRRSPQVIQTY